MQRIVHKSNELKMFVCGDLQKKILSSKNRNEKLAFLKVDLGTNFLMKNIILKGENSLEEQKE